MPDQGNTAVLAIAKYIDDVCTAAKEIADCLHKHNLTEKDLRAVQDVIYRAEQRASEGAF